MLAIQAKSGFDLGSDVVLTFDAPITPGNTIVVLVGGDLITKEISDVGGNTYTLGATAVNGTDMSVWAFYALDAIEPGDITILSDGSSFVAGTIAEYPPVSAVRDAVGQTCILGPLELDLQMVPGDFITGFAVGLSNSPIIGAEVNGDPASLLPETGFSNLNGFDYLAISSGVLPVRALVADEGGVFGAIVAMSLIPQATPSGTETALFMGGPTLIL